MGKLFEEAALEIELDQKLTEPASNTKMFSFYVQEIDGFRYVHFLDSWEELVIGYEKRPDFSNMELEIVLVHVDISDPLKPKIKAVDPMIADFDNEGSLSHCPVTDNLSEVFGKMFEDLFPEQNNSDSNSGNSSATNLMSSHSDRVNKSQDWELLEGELTQIICAIESFYLDQGLGIENIEVNEFLPYLV